MKVLLFVQNEGDKRPVVTPTGARNRAAAEYAAVVIGQNFHRWWLVECENAEAGRKAICSHEDRYGATCRSCGASICGNYGRILASGGRS